MQNVRTIALPSFVQRTLKSSQLKAHIKQLGGELSRKGRSRNWRLNANRNQLQSIAFFIDHSSEDSWLWLSKLIKEQSCPLTHENLIYQASQLDNVTIASLTAHTDCTLQQARKVLDELEDLS